MRFRTPTITALAVALAAALAQPASAEDLIQVYDMARASDPQLAAADAQRLSARENVVQSRALLLPSLVGQATVTDNDTDSSSTRAFLNPDGTVGFGTSLFTQDTRQRVYRAQLDQSVFDYSRWTRLRGSKAFSQQYEATYEAALDALFVRVAQVYFDALTAQTNLEAAEAERTAVGRQLEQANQRFEVGLTAITDVHEAQARFDNSRANVIIARDALNDAYYAVEEITGQPVQTLAALADSIPLAAPEPPDQDAWVKVAEEQNPTLASRRFQVAASEADISTARAGHLPTVDLVGDVGRSRQTSDPPSMTRARAEVANARFIACSPRGAAATAVRGSGRSGRPPAGRGGRGRGGWRRRGSGSRRRARSCRGRRSTARGGPRCCGQHRSGRRHGRALHLKQRTLPPNRIGEYSGSP